jgi:hypothetical protein
MKGKEKILDMDTIFALEDALQEQCKGNKKSTMNILWANLLDLLRIKRYWILMSEAPQNLWIVSQNIFYWNLEA